MANRWEPHKDTLRRLYLDQGTTLSKVMQEMKDSYGFTARFVTV
jgi:hypothetical protein